MRTILQVDFPYEGPFGEEMASAMAELAESIAREPGFRWKIWRESRATCEAGGIYLFEDENSARAYLEKHTARLKEFGVSEVNGKVFQVNGRLSEIDHGPV